MKDTLAEGLTMTRRIDIDAERTIDFMGEELRVYATPAMSRDIEIACRDLIFAHLDAGEDTVGARIEVDHLGAGLMGSWVDVTVTVVEVDGRRVTLESDVNDPLDLIGKARHVRFVIDMARQKQRLEAKAAKLKEGAG